ncbi:MAG: tripartite tricarboxylate transporter substrate binding protein [Burkholderiaceae bacterium]
MHLLNFLRVALTSATLLLCGTAAHADYPDKPIRLVVPYPPGGVADTLSRVVGERLSQRLGQVVIIDNKAGGRQMIGAENVAKATPDGYTLLLGSVTSLSLNPASGIPMRYDPVRDLAPVSRLFHAPLLLVTPAEVPAKSVQELVAYVKAHPGKLSFASIGPGSSTHIAAELFKQEAKLDLAHVPYKGSAPALTDLLAGRVQMMFDGGTSSLPHVASGKLKLLAVTTLQRFPALPDVPTMAESGFPGFDVTAWWGILAPAGTPPAIVERVAKEVRAITEAPELREQFMKNGVVLQAGTPKDFAAYIEQETKRWTSFAKNSGIAMN